MNVNTTNIRNRTYKCNALLELAKTVCGLRANKMVEFQREFGAISVVYRATDAAG